MMLDRTAFDELAKARGDLLVTICMPTHRAGPEIRQDPIRLKNLIGSARERALARGADRLAIDRALARAEALLEDLEFWRHQGDGLALLLDGERMRIVRLSHAPTELADVGERFNVRPLLPSVSDGATFHLLALAQGSVRLFECSRSGMRQVDMHDIPTSLADALGWDVEQKSLQFHTGTSPGPGERAAVFHGQGSGADESDDELERFVMRVDKGLAQLLGARERPMVLAGVERDVSMYQRVSDHPNLADDAILGNPEHVNPDDLRARALEILAPTLDSQRRRALSRIGDKAHPDRTIAGVEETLGALADARVESLAVRTGGPLWGRYDRRAGVELSDDGGATPRPEDDDLLGEAVHRALESGARVYAVETDDLPVEAALAGSLRF